MPRKRHISPNFFTNAELYEAEQSSGLPLRLAFAGLWTVADREGRFAWQPARHRLAIVPFDAVDFGAVLDALAAAQFIVRYEVDGIAYGYIPTWHRHQHPHPREAASRLPPPPNPSGGDAKDMPRTTPGRALDRSSRSEFQDLRSIKTLGDSSPRSVGVPEPPAPDPTPEGSAQFADLARRLPATGGIKWTVVDFLEAAPHGKADAWVPILLACLDGLDLPGCRPCTPEQLATTCRDFMTKAPHEWTPKWFRTCVAALMRSGARSEEAPTVAEIVAAREQDQQLAQDLAAGRQP